MDQNTDNLKLFFERIKTLSFWQRVFHWSSMKALSYEAYGEFKRIAENVNTLNTRISERELKINDQEKNIQVLTARLNDLSGVSQKLENRVVTLESELKRTTAERSELTSKIARYDQTEKSRFEEFQKNVSGVNAVRAGLEAERQKISEERLRDKEESFERMKLTWRNHEETVKTSIRNICLTQLIEYVKEVPFKGKPDNTVRIAGEYVIFDAKSPAGDDLENFPKYLKVQAESLNKYIRQENVRSDIFMVIPSNTVDVVKQYSYKMADYNVYIVTIDALEPIILSLKKIEDYEFAEQLTPEERENICRIIGKFTHTAKRKIMIDYFFSFQFLDIVSKLNISLPADILKAVEDFEKAEKLNPPQEKRAKQILTEDIISESEKLATEMRARMIGNDNSEKDK